MVRLVNKNNINFIADKVYCILRLQEKMTHIEELNNPNQIPCIYAMWHANQFLVHGIEHKDIVSILISNSIDGEIVTYVSEKWGFKVVRGSSKRKGAVEASMQMIKRLNEGECVAIMVDGPHGPLHKVKNGAIKLAQKTGVPIIPVTWYSPQFTFVSFPSWDKMKLPVGKCNILNIYGEPIYVSEDADEEELKKTKKRLKKQLETLDKKAPELYKEAQKRKLWKK